MKHLHYGWVILVIAFFIMIIAGVMIYAFGVFFRPLTIEFNWDRGALSAVVSIGSVVSGFLAILSGRLSDKYGPRMLVTVGGLFTGIALLLMSQVNSLWQVYLFWGLLRGIGSGCLFTPVMSTVPRWFAKNRGLAIGITATGVGLGGIISPPLAQWLISSYSWQQAFIVLGLMIFIIIIPLAQFMKHSPQAIGLSPYGEGSIKEDKQPLASATEGISYNQAIRNWRFWTLGSIQLCFVFALMVVITHIVPYAVDIGISAMVAASILSTIAVTSLIGRNLAAFISDKVGGRLTQIACLTIATLALIWLLFARESWMLYVFALAYGLPDGGMNPLLTIVTAELFGLSSLGTIIGSIYLFAMVGGAIGAPLVGSIFDITGSYSPAFIIMIATTALATILSLILLKAKTWRDETIVCSS